MAWLNGDHFWRALCCSVCLRAGTRDGEEHTGPEQFHLGGSAVFLAAQGSCSTCTNGKAVCLWIKSHVGLQHSFQALVVVFCRFQVSAFCSEQKR